MAVLEAVRGWEELAGLVHIGEAEKEAEGGEACDDEAATGAEDGWIAEKLENDLTLLNTDHVSLLLEHEEHIRARHDEGFICE